jgi:integrating conjugative element membrane protein (TIGR03747 family)
MKPSQPKPKSGIGFGLGLIVKIIKWLLICSLVPLLIATVILVFKGRSAGLVYLQNLFHDQLLWIKSTGAHVDIGQGLLENILQWVQGIQAFATSFTRVNDFPATIHYIALKKIVVVFCPFVITYGSALLITLQLTLLRVVTVLLFVPIFLLLGAVGLIDGAVQRYLRRINGGRESTLIYHHARNAVLPALFISSGLYVVLPFNLSPLFLLLPGAVLFAVCLFFTAKTFKKYL